MAGGKETPRQKMIGLMYLVLMALLAMNVSKEVINAFITLNNKIDRSNEIIKGTMDGVYGSFESAIAGLQAQKASPQEIENVKKIQGQAEQIKSWSKSLVNYFVEQSDLIIKTAGDEMYGDHDGHKSDKHYTIDDQGYYHLLPLDHLSKKDDYDVPSHLYVGGDFKNPTGEYIVDSIMQFRDKLCNLIANYKDDKGQTWTFESPAELRLEKEGDEASIKAFKEELMASMQNVNPADTGLIVQLFSILTPPKITMNHGDEYPWIAKQFDHAPLVAAIAMFTSIRSDILQAESKAVNQIASRVKAPKFNFNKIEPLAFSSTSYINQGDSLNLSVMIAAYDSTEAMKLNYWIDDSTKSADNKKTFKGGPGDKVSLGGAVGGHTVYGEIAVKEKGVEKWKGWKFNYSVGAPNAAVAAADLNVLYKGWKNKIKVSASGYDPSTVSVSCSGCSISKQGEFFIATAGSGKEATISVTAKDDKGNSVNLASEKFRIFPLPKPAIFFGGKSGGTVSKAAAGTVPKLVAKLENSPLNVKYKVTKFDFFTVKNGQPITIKNKGANISSKVKSAIKATPKRGSLTFANIYVVGPSGKEQKIDGGLVIKVK